MISFSANVKRELCRTAPGAKCCALAEMLGALLYANHFSASCIRIVTENPEFAARLPRLLQRGFGLRFDALPEPEAQGKRVLVLEDPEKISHVFTLCGFSAESSLALHVNLALLENDCCRRAFLRGAFLAGGSVTDPAKRYHLEFSTSHRRVCAETGTLLLEMGLTPKQTERKGSSILYFKQSETIEELLALMGAPVSAMTVMQAKIEKDWRNDANRKTNCDTANVTKAVDAAQEQLAALRTLEAQGRLDTLPEKLLQTALLRREHPEATLSELAELHKQIHRQPPHAQAAGSGGRGHGDDRRRPGVTAALFRERKAASWHSYIFTSTANSVCSTAHAASAGLLRAPKSWARLRWPSPITASCTA